MFIFYQEIKRGKKGQVVSVLTVILITFIIAAFIAVNTGKVALENTRLQCAAKSAVLAGGSTASVILNNMSHLNDRMVLTTAGFATTLFYMTAIWVVDLITYTAKIIASPWDPTSTSWKLIWGMINQGLNVSMFHIQIAGTRKVQTFLANELRKMNREKLPKNSANTNITYAFMNAGVDEPKIPYALVGGSWENYLIVSETGFEAFMRTLPLTLDARGGPYNTALVLSHTWQDKRTGKIISNTITARAGPVSPLNMTDLYWKDLVNSAKLRSELKQAMEGTNLSWKWFFKFAIDTIPVTNHFITVQMNIAYLGLAAALLITSEVIAPAALKSYQASEKAADTCCKTCVHPVIVAAACLARIYFAAQVARVQSLMGTYPGLIAAALVLQACIWFLNSENGVSTVPVFEKEEVVGNPRAARYGLGTVITRTTSPGNISYGIYTMKYPARTGSATGCVTGGSIFPPIHEEWAFDIEPDW